MLERRSVHWSLIGGLAHNRWCALQFGHAQHFEHDDHDEGHGDGHEEAH